MSRRYGRNQKRAHKAKIAEAEAETARVSAQLQSEQYQHRQTRARLSEVKGAAFNEFLSQSGQYEAAVEHMSRELGRALGPKLMPEAEKVLRAGLQGRPPIRFEAFDDPMDMRVTRISGEIPALRYTIQIAGY